MRLFFGVITSVLMMSLANGCASPPIQVNNVTSENQMSLPPVGNFNDRMKNLADQLDNNAISNKLSNTYIVTSFTNLDKLGDTTSVGRLISENLMHGLQVHKWQILEARLTKGIDVNAAGEFSLSRDINKLKDEYKISGIVTGTYSVAEGNLTVNARVIDINTGILISSAQTYIPTSWLPDTSFSNDINTKSMKIVSDGIK
ncbi:MAG: FlgO family outer membrane protein [Geobacteraceae bacterium]|nr:FlgO family outer membrane protein [Geobacteraceae bacterium]